MNSNDINLLRRYVSERSEDAFTELVRQRIGLVYSAALRQLGGDTHLAEEVTQSVFTDLACKAPSLTRHSSLAGWLYTSTRYAAVAVRRANARRSNREQEAHAMSQVLQSVGPTWEEIRPILDEAMHDLKAADREAVLLRFFDQLPLAELGTRLGVSENAARMRVDRALDRLRAALVKRGVTSTSAALAAALTSQTIVAAPVGLAASVSQAALMSAAAASGLSLLLARLTLKFKLTAGAAVLATVIALPLFLKHSDRSVSASIVPIAKTAIAPAVQKAAALLGKSLTASISTAAVRNNTLHVTLLADDVNQPIPDVQIRCTITRAKQPVKTTLISRRNGVCDVPYPEDLEAIELVTQKDGFGDTVLHWEPGNGDTIPTNYTARLVRAMHMGGYVQETDGTPVSVKIAFVRAGSPDSDDPAVHLNHEHHEFKRIEITSDAWGRWSLDRIASDMIEKTAAMIDDGVHVAKIEILYGPGAQARLREGNYVFTLTRSPMIRGTVVDSQGNPIAQASIANGEFDHNGILGSEDTSRTDGYFAVKRDLEGKTTLTFGAKGFVPQVVHMAGGTEDVFTNIVLEQGRTLQLKVTDQAGGPVADAKIVAPFDNTPPASLGKTDRNGRATLHEAPAGTMALYVYAGDYEPTNVTLTVDSGEHLVTLTKQSVVSGTVTDATTGQPIPIFRVICGGKPLWGSEPFTPSGFSEDWYQFNRGTFRLKPGSYLSHFRPRPNGYMLKFEVNGYAPCVSRLIQADELDTKLDITLVPAQTVNITVLNPDGRPAADTQVGLIGGQLSISLGIGHFNSVYSSAVLRTDSRGIVALPPDDSIRRVMAINSQGVVTATPAGLAADPTLQLQPFGRLDGQLLLSNQPAADKKLNLYPEWGDPDLISDYSTVTDGEGRFSLSQLPPGKYHVSALLSDSAKNYEPVGTAEVRSGETSSVALTK